MKKQLLHITSLSFILLFTASINGLNTVNFNTFETNIEFVEFEIEDEDFFSLEKSTEQISNISGGKDLEDQAKRFFAPTYKSYIFLTRDKIYSLERKANANHLIAKYILNCSLIFYA